MSEPWYYAENGQQQGPISFELLREMASGGRLTAGQMVWREGLAEWVHANTIDGLFPPGTAPTLDGTQQISYAGPQINYYNPSGAVIAYAGFWWRALAWLLDTLILLIPRYALQAVFETAMQSQTLPNARSSLFFMQIGSAAGLLNLVIDWLYFAVLESSEKQATLGKMICGLQVTDQSGARIGFGRATGRHFGKILSGMILAIGYIMAAFTERKQALHDIMAGTLVIRKNLPQG